VILLDGSSHEVDSSDLAFKIAGSMAFKAAAQRAEPVLLEPLVSVEIAVPEEFLGDVIGDLNARRGKVDRMEAHLRTQILTVRVPLAEMFGYVNQLRSMTQGRANHTMQFAHYEATPKQIQEEVIARIGGRSR
jgi:elongation factor G